MNWIWILSLTILSSGLLYVLLSQVQKRARQDERAQLENQLRQSQRLETLGQLTSGIAHDFNNVISIILGYGQMAQENSPKGSRARTNIDEALKAAYRARDLLEQLLALSRGTVPERKPLPLAPLVFENTRLLRASLPRTVRIHQEIDPETGTISADASQVHQILINIGLNAGYAMRGSGGTLTVHLTPQSVAPALATELQIRPGRYAALSISDTGVGIPAQVRHRIFEPFFTTKPPGEGTGLGLSLVQSIVRSYDGAVSATCPPEGGTTFTAYFPLLDIPQSDQPAKTPGSNHCILFVDDEEDLLNLGREMLERMGYEVVTQTDSVEAYKAFQHQPDRFHLVITDYFMPNLTGTDLARKMKDIRPDIPLILLTGYSTAISREKAAESGFSEYLQKPMATQELSQAIHRLLPPS
ncbi:MAG: response regulator [bacterium]|nr:response regulator [bacterium]